MYAMHVKNNKNIIQDEVIMASNGEYALVSAGSNAPKFLSLPAFVKYYGQEGRGVDFLLSPDRTLRNPVYTSAEAMYEIPPSPPHTHTPIYYSQSYSSLRQ